MDLLFIKPPYTKIQKIRLIQAIAEAGHEVCVEENARSVFEPLEKRFKFKLHYTKCARGLQLDEILTFSHDEPITAIGSFSRPLIFPKSILYYCREKWTDSRDVKYSFQGVVTIERKNILEQWINDNVVTAHKVWLRPNNSFISRITHRIRRAFSLDNVSELSIGDLILRSSDRGRRYPFKSWDQSYYDLILRSNFILCPSGECKWSYRFFEAIFCGAIPIVDQDCPAYLGFQYYHFEDNGGDMNWSIEVAESNYILALERLTISIDEVELSSLIQN